MLIRSAPDIPSSEITSLGTYLNRRSLMIGGFSMVSAAMMPLFAAKAAPLAHVAPGPFSTDEKKNTREQITTYNNFIEYGSDKSDPARLAPGLLKTSPWKVKIGGECDKPGIIDVDDFIKASKIEERIYRHRSVEGWSMVIPWDGVPLGETLKRFAPNSNAKFVAFQTLEDVKQMPGEADTFVYPWPYTEGLRIDEAMHPLAFLAIGLYGETLPAQNGAPIRLVVPWKYGFKSIKSIVAINFTKTQPKTLWNAIVPEEYGFYSNVNPHKDHPRWSQAKERRIGEFMRRPTQMFNGYGDQVASLYTGMDLNKYY